MIEKICMDVNGTTDVEIGAKQFLSKHPSNVSMIEAIQKHTGIDISGMNEDQLRDVCKN